MGALGLLVGNVAMTSGFLYISHHNYPGGQAMKMLHKLEKDTTGKALLSIFSIL